MVISYKYAGHLVEHFLTHSRAARDGFVWLLYKVGASLQDPLIVDTNLTQVTGVQRYEQLIMVSPNVNMYLYSLISP